VQIHGVEDLPQIERTLEVLSTMCMFEGRAQDGLGYTRRLADARINLYGEASERVRGRRGEGVWGTEVQGCSELHVIDDRSRCGLLYDCCPIRL
jgi:hypothetical protein